MVEAQVQSLLEKANEAYVARDAAREESILKQIVGIDASLAAAQLRLADILAGSHREAEAIDNLDRYLKLWPNTPQVEFKLGLLLGAQGQYSESIRHLTNLSRQYPQDLGVLAYLAQTCQQAGRWTEAVGCLDRALILRPDEPDFLYARAQSLAGLQKIVAAEADLHKALAKAPKPHGFIMLAEICMHSNRFQEAYDNASRAAAMDTGSAEAHILSAKALTSLGEVDKAEIDWEAAAVLTSDKAGLHREMGKEFSAQGMFERAGEAFRQSIREDPNSGETYYLLVSSRRCGQEDQNLVSDMRDLLARRTLPPEDEQQLCYAIGKALDDFEQYEEALQFFDRANLIGVALFQDDSLTQDGIKNSTDAIISRYTDEFIARFSEGGNPSSLPIFVLGMMRSGTTLVEQMLSAHPLVGGAGEQPFWMEYESEFTSKSARPFDINRLMKLSANYLEILSAGSSGRPRAVEKNNCNSYLAGLLAIAFPNSKVVHVQRDPVDTALSIWTTALNDKSSFLCMRPNIVCLLKEHVRLAKHWSQSIPKHQYTELKYENLIERPEDEMRRVVSFLGLEWDDACSRPEANQRAVRTPSYWQTRQPIYKRSGQRWKNYEPWLGEFAELLSGQDGDLSG